MKIKRREALKIASQLLNMAIQLRRYYDEDIKLCYELVDGRYSLINREGIVTLRYKQSLSGTLYHPIFIFNPHPNMKLYPRHYDEDLHTLVDRFLKRCEQEEKRFG